MNLESAIRKIDTILYYIDSKERYVSNKIRKEISDTLVNNFYSIFPKKDFYKRKLKCIDFTRDYVEKDIATKGIDLNYRLNSMSEILPYVDIEVEKKLEKEKTYLLEYNNKTLYNLLNNAKEQGKEFTVDDLTDEDLFELAVIENCADSQIGSIFNMDKSEVKNLRYRKGLKNKFKKKIEKYPEALLYYIEKQNKRDEGIPNLEFENMLQEFMKQFFLLEDDTTDEDNGDTITIVENGTKRTFHIIFSDEPYSVNTKTTNRKNTGAKHNYKKENETKIAHGKIGENIALEAEKLRLKKASLESHIDEVKLLTEIGEDITFDGKGYDLLSINKQLEPICIEVKTSYGKKDKPFYISKHELEVLKGYKEEFDCEHAYIYYLLIDEDRVIIKDIDYIDFDNIELEAVLYKVKSTKNNNR